MSTSKILVISPNYLVDTNDEYSYRSIPPIGYGGVENVVFNLINGYIKLGFSVDMIGSPNSNSYLGLTNIFEVVTDSEIIQFVSQKSSEYIFIHDHSCKGLFNMSSTPKNYIATHHTHESVPYQKNTVTLNFTSHKFNHEKSLGVIRLPVDIRQFCVSDEMSEDYFCFFGRVSQHKGVLEACELLLNINRVGGIHNKLRICGPCWEESYENEIRYKYGDIVEFVGNVYGLKKRVILKRSKGIFILSQNIQPPFSSVPWVEPGCTIVSEAAASGCPIISSSNGCLGEIVSNEIGIILSDGVQSVDSSKKILNYLKNYNPQIARRTANELWNYVSIAKKYVELATSLS